MSSRILMVSNSGSVIGGGEISFHQLITRLDRTRFEPIIACPGPGDFYDMIERRNLRLILEMPTFRGLGLFRLPRSVRAMIRVIHAESIRLVHANGSRCMIVSGLAGLITRTPVVWHVRVLDRDRPLDWLLARLARKIIVNSQAVTQRFSAALQKRIVVAHNGVDVSEFRPDVSGNAIRTEFGFSGSQSVITNVGRLEPAKGQRLFLEAAALVSKSAESARFLIVGDGDDRAELELLVHQLRLDGLVVFAGARHDLPAIMAASDIVVSASAREPFGRVIIEAMATAKPVVAVNGGGVPEVVADGETGILVPPDNPNTMAEALLTLIRLPDEAKLLGERGLERVKAYFTADQHARRVEGIYADLLAAPAQASSQAGVSA